MINFLIFLIISVSVSFGMAIAIVEKGKTWPLKEIRVRLQLLLSKIHWKLPQMLFCTTCTSFWASLVADTCLFIIGYFCFGIPYFFWPLSGSATLGFSWFIIEFLNALDKKQNIINNNYILQQEEKKDENQGKNENIE
jgi:hypothetical protein